MYKLMWYDRNCSPIADGLASFFVDDMDGFEDGWDSLDKKTLAYPIEKEIEGLREKLKRARAGEHFTDWYGTYEDHPELEFLQEDKDAKVIEEKHWTLKDQTLETWNVYLYGTGVVAKEANFTLQTIRFKDRYYLTAKYELLGVAKESWHTSENGKPMWERCVWFGNPVINSEFHGEEDSPDLKNFKDDTLRTICAVTLAEDDVPIEMPEELDEDLIGRILADIPGECG
ncbi:MAG: hypothetical protein IJ794_00225 [Lachnospiraceae bacterium]|nr:hypothetical protein [Lachnospiraceae bacterium]